MIDAKTQQPIKDVHIQRVGANDSASASSQRGGAAMENAAEVITTGSDGTFVVDSERDLAPFHRITWYAISLWFKHSAYQEFKATFTVADATKSPSGEPQVNAGEISLVPLAP